MDKQTVTHAYQAIDEDSIAFVETEAVELYCYKTCESSIDSLDVSTSTSGRWCGREMAENFLEDMYFLRDNSERKIIRQPSSSPLFTFIGGHGNGTTHPLSIDDNLYRKMLEIFGFQSQIRDMVRSMHGVFTCRLEKNDDAPSSLLFLFATPKSSTREMFCALRVVPETSSITCLLFDDKRADLARTAQILCSSLTSESIYRNPTTLLAILIRETGRTCELLQRDLDSIIVEVETQTGSGPWQDAKLHSSPRRWHSFHGAMSALHSSQDKLSFVAQSADFEIDAWRCLRVMADDHKQASHLGRTAFEGDLIAILNTIECEMTHTMTRRAQIGCLRERIGIQINLIHNIIAHQETSQTHLITMLALIITPASLLAGIFGADILPTEQCPWAAYSASTVPLTLMTFAAGLGFLQQKRLGQVWQALLHVLKPAKESPWENEYY